MPISTADLRHTARTIGTRVRGTSVQLTLGAWLVIALYCAERAPRSFSKLFQEDGLGEWLTFALFAAAAAILARAAIAAPSHERLRRFALIGLSLFCVFVAGEELSWGQRLFAFRPPDLFLQNNFQQEANLHNLLKDILDTRFMVCIVALAYGVVGAYLAHVRALPRALAPSVTLLPWFAVVAWLELSYPYELVGELAELFLGALFLVDAVERTQSEPASEPAPRAAAYAWAAVALAALLVPFNDWMLSLRSDEAVATTRTELITLSELMREAAEGSDRLLRKRHIHKRVFTAVKAGYLELDKSQFYLDPWNNPYWVAYQRDGQGADSLFVYSFGPNRRRDSQIDEADSAARLAGDDIGVVIPLARAAHAQR